MNTCKVENRWLWTETRESRERELALPTTKVKLVQRDEVRDMVGSDYIVQSVLLDHNTGRTAEVHPYLQTGFS